MKQTKKMTRLLVAVMAGLFIMMPLVTAAAPTGTSAEDNAWQRMFVLRIIDAGPEDALLETIASGVPISNIARYMLEIGYPSLYTSFLFQQYARDVYGGKELEAYVAEMDSQLMSVGIPKIVIDLSKRMDVADINSMIDRETIDLPTADELMAALSGQATSPSQPGETQPGEEEGLGFGDDATLGAGFPIEQITFNTGADPTVASPVTP
ncbi:MAG: hypothetical protein SWH61_03000 [Thermodesulfobacteriota bacterium]|nr:hypothetical protein [Thermodesulfobacteriota bacterium]